MIFIKSLNSLPGNKNYQFYNILSNIFAKIEIYNFLKE